MRRLSTVLAVLLPVLVCAAEPPVMVEVAPGVIRVERADANGPLAVRTTDGWLVVDGDAVVDDALGAERPVRWHVRTRARSTVSDTVPGLEIAPEARGGDAAVRFRDRLELDGDTMVFDLGRAVTANDAAVWLPARRVLAVGDLAGPVAALGPDTDVGSWISVLERLERLGPAVVVPARGPVGGPELLSDRRGTLAALRDTVWQDLTAGRPPDAIVDARAGTAPETLVRHVVAELSGILPPRELLEERGLEPGPSPTRDDPSWTRPRRVAWRDLWPERLATLQAVAPGVEIVPFRTAEEAVGAVAGADAVIGLLTPEVLAAGDALRWAQVPWAGVEDEVAIPGLASSGIVLTNGQRLASPEIAEHAMALVYALARRLDRALELQSTAHWNRSGYRGEGDLLRLHGKTMLVVGLGGIGTEVARLADAAGMTVLATRNSSRTGPEFVAEVGLAEDLDAMLARADVVVNCLPLTDATRGLFDRATFRLMPPQALFVNVGRGGTVVTDDLIAALRAGELGGAGLDVTDPEPLPDDHPLWSTPGVLITPHSAAVSDAGRERLWLLFRENLRRFVAGEPLLSVVDIERGY